MPKKHTVHVIPHTHWDREWYGSFQQFRMRLVHLVDKLLAILASHPEYVHFNMDGQVAPLVDYLEIRPERRAEMEQQVEMGRLAIGPWFVLPDEFIPSAEAHVHNLMLGLRLARAFGGVQKEGYIPDTFGHIGQLPQIFQGFGISTAAIWRGVNPALNRSEAWWEAPDGSRVLTAVLPTWGGYGTPAILPYPVLDAANEFLTVVQKESERASTNLILSLAGVDHVEPRADFAEILRLANEKSENAEFLHSSLTGYFNALRAAVAGVAIPTLRGEQRETAAALGGGIWNFLLYNVLSARIYNKMQNAHAQTLLERWAEPWSALLAQEGWGYPGAFLWRAWQWLLENHPHDSIGGCSVDEVHSQMETRFAWASDIADHVTEDRLQLAGRSLDLSGVRDHEAVLVVFNGVAWDRDDVCTANIDFPTNYLKRLETSGILANPRFRGIHVRPLGSVQEIPVQLESIAQPMEISRDAVFGAYACMGVTRVRASFRANLPAFGYRAYAVWPDADPVKFPVTLHSANVLENAHLRVVIAPNGTLTVTDKATGQVFRDLAYFEDGGEVGDGYNYSPPMFDRAVNTLGAAPRIVRLADGPALQRYTIEYDLVLPAGLDGERRRRVEHTVTCPLRVVVSLGENSRRVDLEIALDNRARDHRLRIFFPSDICAAFSQGEGHFDVVDNPVHREMVSHDVWIEDAPVTYAQQTWMDVSRGDRALCLATFGIQEYEVKETERREIALTLLRAVAYLGAGRDAMTIKTGAGPKIPTPGAQCLRELTYRLAIIPHAASWDQAEVWREAHAFVAGARAVSFDKQDMTLFGPDSLVQGHHPAAVSRSLLRVEGKNAVLSAVKGCDRDAGDHPGVIVRLCNPSDTATMARLTFAQPARAAQLTDLDEEPQGDLVIGAEGTISLSLAPKKILTVKVTF